jgi:transcriptional repressor NrdR
MRCPFCGFEETAVRDSRPAEEGVSIRRRRSCPECHARFTTFERIELPELTVIKSNGRREDFVRDKLKRSLSIALRKRPLSKEDLDILVGNIIQSIHKSGEHDIPSHTIGTAVMAHLKEIDSVAYVRYASVYKNFKEATDFKDFIIKL